MYPVPAQAFERSTCWNLELASCLSNEEIEYNLSLLTTSFFVSKRSIRVTSTSGSYKVNYVEDFCRTNPEACCLYQNQRFNTDSDKSNKMYLMIRFLRLLPCTVPVAFFDLLKA